MLQIPATTILLIAVLIMLIIIFAIILIFLLSKKNNAAPVILDHHQELSNIAIPTNLPFPYALFSSQSALIACNEKFTDLFDFKIFDKTLAQIIPDLTPNFEQIQIINIGGKFYNVYFGEYKSTEGVSSVISICLVDVTENANLRTKLDQEKVAIAQIFIDNYRDVIDTINDDSAPLLKALIDRKLNDMASEVNGIIKKLEKDSYIFLCSKKSIEKLKENKFAILSEIKEINVGEHMPITLSIGVGINDGAIDTSMKYSKSAIDLALGRGGDQVVIKENDSHTFFGGKSEEGINKSRIRARVKADALRELISESDRVFIMGHKSADLDSLGASLGVYRISTSLNRPTSIILNTVSPGVTHLCKKLSEHEEYEKVFITNQKAVSTLTDRSLVIIMDTHKPDMVECPEILSKTKRIIVFDHHRKSATSIENCVLVYHEPHASSTSELVTEMIQYMGEKVKLKPLEADALLAGITVDTKHFSIQTGSITFETSAYLKRNGADSVRVRKLFQNDMAAYKAKASAVKDAQVYRDVIAISICPSNLENAQLAAAQAADELLNIIGINASFVFSQIGDTIYCSGRSLGNMNVQIILEKLGGGGHRTVSGGQFKDITIDQAIENLKKAIDEYLQEE